MKYSLNISKQLRSVALLIALSLFISIDGTFAQKTPPIDQLIDRAGKTGLGQQTVQQLVDRSRKQKIPDDQMAAMIQPAVELAETDLPGQMIVQKAMEGLAKGVPAGRIIPVLQRMQQSVHHASDLVTPWMNRQEVQSQLQMADHNNHPFKNEMVEAVAKDLMQNVGSQNIHDFLTQMADNAGQIQLDRERAVMGVRVLSDMVTTDKNPGMSTKLLIRAMKAGFSPADLQQLPSAMKAALKQSRLPAEAVANGISRQLNKGVPASGVLHNLMNGNVQGGPPGGTPPGMHNNPGKGNRGNSGNGGNNGHGNNGNNGNHGNNGDNGHHDLL